MPAHQFGQRIDLGGEPGAAGAGDPDPPSLQRAAPIGDPIS